MDQDRWERIQAVFHAVADLPPGVQDAALHRECDGDDDLMRDVLQMLQADSSGASVLDQPLSQMADSALDQPVLPPPAFRKVGPYEIQKVLGEGGMGTVFFAVREDLGTAAAIKILRDAWVSPARRERFAMEQYTLANLDHPSIARLLDADTLSDGTPFFVMEYVDGLHLDIYCETHRCSVADRLTLFRSVCKAVEFAHAHAVIHRDLKPSNVLVREGGEIKLLDFGVAKHLDQIGPAADQTRTGLRLLTPAFAAPEQIRGEPAAVGSDVYSLGVILYRLLAGRLPFDDRSHSPAEALPNLNEREAVRPSLVSRRVAQQGGSIGSAVIARPSEWADLDVICLTAMHPDVQKRYGSAEALIRDIDHYLLGEPLDARADTFTYRLGKFVRRHRTAVAASAAVLVMVAILVSVFMTRLAAERNAAIAEAARTQRIQQFTRNLFQGGDKDAGPANQMRIVTLIDRGVQEARALDNDPEAQAELYHTLGEIYHKLGSLEQAEELFNSAISKREAISGARSAPVAESMTGLALLRADQAKFEDAERLSRQALEISRQALPPGHPGIAAAMHALGHVLEEKGSYNEAIPVLENAVRLRSGRGQSESGLAESLYELANVYFYAGRYNDAEALNRRVLAMNRDIYGETHPRVADVLVNLGAIQQDLGHYDKAEQFHRQALQITRSFYGENHYRTAAGFTMVARALVFQKRFDDATQLLNSALAVQERVFGPVHPRVASALNELGTVALQRGRYPEARAKFERMRDIYRSVYAGKHYLIGTAVSNLASAYMAERENSRAEGLFREAVSMFTATLSPDHLNTGIARVKLGRTLLRQKRFQEAETETSAGFAILKKQMNPSASWLETAQADLAEIYSALGQPDKSAALAMK